MVHPGDGTRTDPETGEPLKPGHLTRAELRRHLAEMRRRWQRWAFAAEPPGPDWVMVESVGWVRKKGEGRGR